MIQSESPVGKRSCQYPEDCARRKRDGNACYGCRVPFCRLASTDPGPHYSDGDRQMFVSDGISRQQYWGTFYRTARGSLKRFRSPKLPMRRQKEQAERELAAYAQAHHWRRVV